MSAKTRFIVEMAGKQVELFSVQERKDKSLLVFPHRACEPTNPLLGRIKDEHLSVHLSPQSPGTTIKRTCVFKNGREETFSSFVADSKDSLLWPLFSATAPRFTKANLKARARDRIVTITRFHHRSATLVYSVFVSSCGFEHSPWSSPMNLVRACFEKFEIGVFFSFIPLGSLNTEEIQIPATAPRRIDGVADPGQGQAQPSFEAEEAEQFVMNAFANLGGLMHFRLLQFKVELTPEVLNLFRVGTQTFLKHPPPFEEEPEPPLIFR